MFFIAPKIRSLPLLALGAFLLHGCANSPRLERASEEPSSTTAPLLGLTPLGAPAQTSAQSAEAKSPGGGTLTASAKATLGADERASLSAAEREALLTISEHEKLARDVYAALAQIWRLDVFNVTSGSENIQADELRTLLARYDLSAPSAALPPGRYTRPELERLHRELLARGRLSPADALKVAASVEELEIIDTMVRLEHVSARDVHAAFSSLLASDKHHLRSLVAALRRLGHTYTPTRLSREDYRAIIDATPSG